MRTLSLFPPVKNLVCPSLLISNIAVPLAELYPSLAKLVAPFLNINISVDAAALISNLPDGSLVPIPTNLLYDMYIASPCAVLNDKFALLSVAVLLIDDQLFFG